MKLLDKVHHQWLTKQVLACQRAWNDYAQAHPEKGLQPFDD